MEINLDGYCYRITEDVVITLAKREVEDELTLEKVVKKEILCDKSDICGMAAESCPVVQGIINEARKKKKQ